MASVVFYFQLHQPFRLRRYSVFDSDPFYFDNHANQEILLKVAEKCYRPATQKLLDLVRRHEGRFRVTFSVTVTALQQLEMWAPDVIETLRALVGTGACELLDETSHHSLAFLFSKDEFNAQVKLHNAEIARLFDGYRPRAFRNTELIYNDELAGHVAWLGGYGALLCEGTERLLGHRSPNYVYSPPKSATPAGHPPVRLLLKNFRLSDDIAFRFSDRSWKEWPLDAGRFAKWVNQINGDGHLCNLFMDYETFGEHQWASTGIFDFLDKLPEAIFDVNPGHNDFQTVSEAAAEHAPVGDYSSEKFISWADSERDLSAWLGNPLQDNSAEQVFALEAAVKARHAAGDEWILEDWRKLTTSDHLYYMCTKFWSDGDVHKYFSPYDSPYDAYINFMNVLDHLRTRAGA